MRGLGILILIVIFFWLIWPTISRWLKRKAMERAEDYMRSTMGMPPRDKSKKRSGGYNSNDSKETYNRRRKNPYGHETNTNEPLIPKEYAEDVEFTETIDYSSTEFRSEHKGGSEEFHESQISDVEWTEIKKSHSK